jgi:hypothetical protein
MSDEALPEERLAELLSLLQPAPPGWVEAAIELPAASAQLDSIVARAVSDAAYRAEVLADLEHALEADGVEPTEVLRRELARRLAREQ